MANLLLLLLGAPLALADASTYGVNAVCSNDQLMRWYNADLGLWTKPDGSTYWWESANMLTAYNDLAAQNDQAKSVYNSVWDSTFRNAPAHNPNAFHNKRSDGSWEKTYKMPSAEEVESRRKLKRDEAGFLGHYYDDEGWWALAWIGALDNTGTREYLDEAIAIWYDMNAAYGKPKCGGLQWNRDSNAPTLAIENELYISLGAAISNRVGDDQKNIYLGAAKDAWQWFQNSGLINQDNLINDGLNDQCQNDGNPTYSYNQGVILGGLAEMYKATGDTSYLDSASAIADAVTKPGSPLLDGNGILVDSCDKSHECSGDGIQFKGVFARNLKQLQAVRPSAQWKAFLETNAQSIWNNDIQIEDGGCKNGVYWGGPYASADASSQSSALDCLNAALYVTSPGPGSRNALPAPRYSTNQQRANAVKEAFNHGWNGYLVHAFPHDSLKPVSNSYTDDRNGWGATAIDALSTAIIMENVDAVNTILDYIPNINYEYSATDVSLFETSIRYLGGMLSGYDLLDGPMSHLINGNMSRIAPILSQSRNLADNLKVAFTTPSGIPVNGLEFRGSSGVIRHNDPQSGIAGCTLILEWQRLSDLLDDPQYGDLDKKAINYLLDPQPKSNEPFPGLIGQNFDPNNGKSIDASGGWIGGSDSFYEYLAKAYIYDKTTFEKYMERWSIAAQSSIKYLASHPSSRPDLTWLAAYHNTTVYYYSEHLACFDGGNFILGGFTLGDQALIKFGLELTQSCHETYISTGTAIGPDSWSWQDSTNRNDQPPSDQVDRFNKYGFWINNANYALRPEVIESYYYAYRATGDSKYQDWAWDAFQHINNTCRVGSGFAELNDVNDPSKGFQDIQDTYFFAEVLKYSYMIHADNADWQVKADQTNQFIFNTEGHPLRLANGATG